ncbi:HhH-GPD-type base excision DNA repair protein [Micromonospora sp. NPDC003197]
MALSLPIDPAANELVVRNPLALLLGMLLDQQVSMEKAFSAPYDLARRLGHEPDAYELANFDPEALVAIFSERPALHRFPKAMAARVQEMCRILVERYDGEAAQVWADAPDGATALRRIGELPGFGKQKAQIFLALLGKQFDVRPPGWQEAAGVYGEDGVYRSVADITDSSALARVREYKQQMKAAAQGTGPRGAAPGTTAR